MHHVTVPLVCAGLWLAMCLLGIGLARCKNHLAAELRVQPDGWPLSNFAVLTLEIITYVAGMVAFVVVKETHDLTPVPGFDSVVGLNVAVYALMFVFVVVYSFELWMYQKRLQGTLVVIASYNGCQLALVVLYGKFLEAHQEPLPFALGLFVFAQKLMDIFWCLRRRDLSQG